MKRLKGMIKVLFIFIVFAKIAVAAEVATVEQLASGCAACHNDQQHLQPKLAGQNQKYFIEQMLNFKMVQNSPRNNPIMHTIAAPLSQQQIEALADYFAKQKITVGEAQQKYVALGRSLYQGGSISAGIPACAACHAPDGSGNVQAGFPSLSGQNADYIFAQLKAFKEETRKGRLNTMMTDIAKKLTDEQMRAVASYISGLH